MTHLIFTLSGAVLFGLTLPLVLELLLVTSANFLPARRQSKTRGQRPSPALAIIVPAHNEELLVARCIASLRASAGSAARILVVAHNCADGTAESAAAAGAEVLVYNDPTAVGKGFALRHGFGHALSTGAGAVMVVDADSTVSPNTVDAVMT